MRRLKHIFIIFSFVILGLFIVSLAIITSTDEIEFSFALQDENVEDDLNYQSFFTNSQYFYLKDTERSLHIDSQELTINQKTDETFFLRPKGVAFTKDDSEVHYEAIRGRYLESDNLLYLIDEVFIEYEDSELMANRVDYDLGADIIHSIGEVKTKSFNSETRDRIRVDSDEMISWPENRQSEYIGNVDGEIQRHRPYEDTVHFNAQRVFMDLDHQLITLTADVLMKKQDLTATSLRGEIYLENYNKDLKYFVLYDDVRLEEKVMLREDSYVRKAFGEKLEGIISEEKLILTGYPKVYQRDDVIKGNRIVLRENNEVIEVEDAQSQFIVR